MQLAIEGRQRLGEGIGHERRQAIAQVAPSHAARVGGRHRGARGAAGVHEEVTDRLGRGRVRRTKRASIFPAASRQAAAELIRIPLQLALEGDAGQRIVAGQVVGAHLHEQRRVSIGPGAGVAAHAVHAEQPLLAGGRHHLPARTHAEAVDAPAVVGLHRQLVVGRPEGRMTSGWPVLGLVHESLGMFNAHAHGEGLAGHVRPGLANHLEGVTRGVPAGQHDAIGGEDFRRSRALIDEANGSDARFAIFAANLIHSISDARTISSSALKHKAVEARKEPYLSPRLLDGPTQVAHDADEQVGANVRLGVHENVLRGAGFHEGLQHMEDMGRLDTGVQLAV